MTPKIEQLHKELSKHSLYKKIDSVEGLQVFMRYHVFAVWDFMSLLKSLQNSITTVSVPWKPSGYSSRLVRLINEIVLAEESDIDQDGQAISHFELYIKAMKEVMAPTEEIEQFIRDLKVKPLPREIQEILCFHLDLALNGSVHEVAASFFYGREKLIPDMFRSIVDIIKANQLNCPQLTYYLERHIELDGDEHGPMAKECLEELLDSSKKKEMAIKAAENSLKMRSKLWDYIESEIQKIKVKTTKRPAPAQGPLL